MLRNLSVLAALVLCSNLAFAAEAGKVIFVAGKASIADSPVAEGQAVQEGQMLTTGPDGFIYVKTIDSGLFILRPNTRARIVSYHVDANNPANTRIKLDLLSGVARSRSGNAVKLARQNFRFNTPVAAIGVRGTDFTVFTDQDTSRVAVISGGVVVSGFAGGCRPDGIGPCEGSTSRELSATQQGQLLVVKRGKAAPVLVEGTLSTDPSAAPHPDEPVSQTGGKSSNSVVGVSQNLDPQKSESLRQASNQQPPVVPTVPPVMPDTGVIDIPAPPPVVAPSLPERSIVWGRWQRLMAQTAKINLATEQAKSELLAVNGNYALFRTPGKDYVAPEKGSIGFALHDSEAFIYSDVGSKRTVSSAMVTNGKLNVDFGTRSFKTSVDVHNRLEKFSLVGAGSIGTDGRMHGDLAQSQLGVMNIQGLLSNEVEGGAAAYIFDARLDNVRTVNGVTYWRK
ncbi:FecR domain-containing protein [Massilia sp. GCM10020059]|uniref:FecR domain-containing protein n=1 Tax=Massilia agrisoli TaxID=2892444 RepID=A0ABS8J0M2_9BURK|nr:FecR family protein [Massilia agrisoli]MCC6073468.1 FecR domain-containing protein [Massilia agrisoli]